MWKKHGTARQASYDDVTRRMRFACWTPKATNTLSEYVILISFLLQQWLHERVSVLRDTTLLLLLTPYDVMETNNKKITWHHFLFVLGPSFNGKENFLWNHSLYGLRPQSHIKNKTEKFRLPERFLSSGWRLYPLGQNEYVLILFLARGVVSCTSPKGFISHTGMWAHSAAWTFPMCYANVWII
jgi:hypothetical protein